MNERFVEFNNDEKSGSLLLFSLVDPDFELETEISAISESIAMKMLSIKP